MSDEPKVGVSGAQPPSSSGIAAISWAILAIAAQVALLDAAIETFWSGSPLRWWIAPPVLVFVALSAWSWRPGKWLARWFGWSGAAATSMLALFALFVASAWIPGGQVDGMRMLRQPTATLLTVATAAAVALAAFTLVRAVSFLPTTALLVTRAVVVALAAYAVVALALGVHDRTPYAALFQGHSLWQRSPFWLQGAFTGGLVLVPLAFLAQIGRVVAAWRRGQLARAGVAQAIFLLAAVAFAAAGVRMAQGNAPWPVIESGDTGLPEPGSAFMFKPMTPEERAALTTEIDKTYQALTEVERDIPRDSFDPASIVAAVGQDPARLFEWVRDNTAWVPYRGELRGPSGVLMDRLGNSVDRSLLLAELLRLAGLRVRLAHATLTQIQASNLIAKVRQPSATWLEPRKVDGNGNDPLITVVQRYGLNAPTLTETALKRRAAYQQSLQDASRRVAEQGPQVAAAVARLSRVADSSASAEGVAAAADHWWVQFNQHETWTDLDPMLPGGAVGQSVATAVETIDPSSEDDAFHLDSAFCQEVEVRVLVDQYKDSTLTSQPVLHYVLRPAELAGQIVEMSNVPLQWPKATDALEAGQPQAERLRKTLESQTRWLPVLRIGRRLVHEKAFTSSGELETLGSRSGGEASGLLGGLGGLMGGEEETPKGDGFLVAEWLEFEVRIPGRAAEVLRHQVFDLIGPARRAEGTTPASFTVTPAQRFEYGLALLGNTEILALPFRVSSDFVMHLNAASLLEPWKAWLDLARENDTAQQREKAAVLARQDAGVSALYSFALARTLLSPVVSQVYSASPGILISRARLGFDPRDRLVSHRLIDVLRNDVAVLPSVRDPFTVRVQQGVADTAAEHMALHNEIGCENTTTVFALAVAQGRRLLALDSTSTAVLTNGLPGDVRARLMGEFSRRSAVVAPNAPVLVGSTQRIGWFSVRADDGRTIGVMDTGYHQTSAETAKIQEDVGLADTQISKAASGLPEPGGAPGTMAEGAGSPGGTVVNAATRRMGNQLLWLRNGMDKITGQLMAPEWWLGNGV